jgi:hypothetical protein
MAGSIIARRAHARSGVPFAPGRRQRLICVKAARRIAGSVARPDRREGYADAPADGSARPAPAVCEKRVVRGGAWVDGPSTSRSAYRYAEEEPFRNYQVGFRVAREMP